MWYTWNKGKMPKRFVLKVTWDVMLKNTAIVECVIIKRILEIGV
jgi:hypothetical protein